jgi:hypothetical protein
MTTHFNPSADTFIGDLHSKGSESLTDDEDFEIDVEQGSYVCSQQDKKSFTDLDVVAGRLVKISLSNMYGCSGVGNFSLIWRSDEDTDFTVVEFRSSSSIMMQEDLHGFADTWILVPETMGDRNSRFHIFTVDGLMVVATGEGAFLCNPGDKLAQTGISVFDISFDVCSFTIHNCELADGDTMFVKRMLYKESSNFCIHFSESFPSVEARKVGSSWIPAFLLVNPSSFSSVLELDLMTGSIEQTSLETLAKITQEKQVCFLLPSTESSMTTRISSKYSCSLKIDLKSVRSQIGSCNEHSALRINFVSKDGSDVNTSWFSFSPRVKHTKYLTSVQRLESEVQMLNAEIVEVRN